MDLEHGRDDGVQVVGFRLRCVQNVNWESAARHKKDRGVIEELAKLVRVQRRTRNDELEIGAKASNIFEQAKQNVGAERAFMSLVNHDGRVRSQIRVGQEFPKKHTICHVLDDGLVGCAVFKADTVAAFLPEAHAHFISDASSHTHGCYASRLRACYHLSPFCVSRLMKKLG